MNTFKDIIAAVEENNRINNAQWKDWDDCEHIESVYGTLDPCNRWKDVAKAFIDVLIRDNGDNINIYLDVIDCLEYGHTFTRN